MNEFDALEALPMPRSKAELLARITPARAALDALVAAIPEAALTAVGHEGWSVKDHIAHIATWERMIVAHLRDGSDAAVAGMDEVAYAAASLDEINARIHETNRTKPAPQVIAEARAAYGATVAMIEGLADGALAQPYWADEPDGRVVMEKIAGDTYRHYLEHRRWIIELLDRLPGGG